jgi:hypothetical protein
LSDLQRSSPPTWRIAHNEYSYSGNFQLPSDNRQLVNTYRPCCCPPHDDRYNDRPPSAGRNYSTQPICREEGGHARAARNHSRPPRSRRKPLLHALADAYADGALSAGHEVSRIEIARIDFRCYTRSKSSRLAYSRRRSYRRCDALAASQHVLIVFPLWHGTMPALLKAFIEQVMRPGVALDTLKKGSLEGCSRGVRPTSS